MQFTYSEATYDVVEAGVYAGKLREISQGTGQYGDFLRFEWTLLDDGGADTDATISGLCNPLLNSRSKLSAWVQAHLGEGLSVGQEINLDGLIGKSVMLTVNVEPRQDSQGDRNRVTAVSPMRRKAAPSPVRPAVSAAATRLAETPF